MGRIVPEIEDPEIRELIIMGYRLIYRFMNEIVQVIAVRHSKQSFHL